MRTPILYLTYFLVISFFFQCTTADNKFEAKQFSPLVMDYIHQDSISELFWQADSLRWELDYKKAIIAYNNLRNDKNLSVEAELYARNQLTHCFLFTHELEKAKEHIQIIEVGLTKKPLINSYLRADYLLNKGRVLRLQRAGKKARDYLIQSLDYYSQLYPENHLKRTQVYNELGLNYWFQSTQVDSAIYYIDLAEDIFNREVVLHPFRIYHRTTYAISCLNRRDHYTGLLNADIALDLAKKTPYVDSFLIAQNYNTKGLMLKKLNQPLESEKAYQKAIALVTDEPDIYAFKELFTRDLLFLYANLKDSVSFLTNLRRLQQEHSNQFQQIDTNRILGYYFYDMKDFKKSVIHYEAFVKKQAKHDNLRFIGLDDAYYSMAYAHKYLNNFALAEQNIINNILIGYPKEKIDIKKLDQFPEITSKLQHLIALGQLAEIYTQRYLVDASQMDYLKKAFKFYKTIDGSFFEQINTFEEDATLFFLENDGYRIYSNAVKNAYLLYQRTKKKQYLEWANTFIDRSKSFVLYKELLNKELRYNTELPNTLLEKEKRLAQKIEAIKSILPLRAESPPNYELFQLLQEQKKFYELVKTKYVQHFSKTIKHQEIPTLAEIESVIKKRKENILQFQIGEENIYALYFTPTQHYFFQFPKTPKLDSQIVLLRTLLTRKNGFQESKEEVNQYATISHQLYESLIQPFVVAQDDTPKWTIIPDQYLHTLSFSCLTTAKGDYNSYKDLPFLIQKKEIKYAISLKSYFWSLNKRKPITKDSKVLAYAYSTPNSNSFMAKFYRGESWSELAGTAAEVSFIQANFRHKSNQFLYGKESHKTHFLNNGGGYDIIHLGLHATSNPDKKEANQIVFRAQSKQDSSNILYAYQLRSLTMNADLAVLNACESAFGKIVRGEGVYSLARSFIQAGTRQVVASSWKAEDVTTESITKDFYKYLKKGMPPASAIHQAQLAYLAKPQNPGFPGFWSHLVCYH